MDVLRIDPSQALTNEQLFARIPDDKPAGRRDKVKKVFDKLSSDQDFLQQMCEYFNRNLTGFRDSSALIEFADDIVVAQHLEDGKDPDIEITEDDLPPQLVPHDFEIRPSDLPADVEITEDQLPSDQGVIVINDEDL